MTGVLEIVEASPTLYVLAVAWLLYLLGNALRMRVPILSAWQEALGASTFVMLALRRLVWSPPTDPGEVIVVLMRAASFGVIAFGLTGTIGIAWMTAGRSISRLRDAVGGKWNRWRRERERRSIQDRKPTLPPTARELERQRVERERIQQARRQREADTQRRRELRLQTELAMEFALDQDRRQTLAGLMEKYAGETLPVDVYQERLAMIERAITQYSPRRAKRFQSMQEIIDEFDRQLQDLEQSSQPEIEKESIRSMILMERNTAIQRLIEQ